MKYEINKDFKRLRFATFPIIKPFAYFSERVLGALMKINHSDQNVHVARCTIDVDNGSIKALLFEPRNCDKASPAVIYFHGGAFVYKAGPYHYKLVKEYCAKTPCKVLMADYRLSTHNPFPIPVDDCCRSLKWLLENAEDLGIDKSKIIVAGDSAGGDLAAAVTLMARDNRLADLCGQMLIYPVTDRRMKTPSMEKYTDTPVWNSRLSKKMWALYLPGSNVENIEYASPMEAKDLSGLPDAFIETAEFDCLHDEGAEYAKALKEAGNTVFLNETKNTVHGFDMALKSQIVVDSIKKRIEFLQSRFYNR